MEFFCDEKFHTRNDVSVYIANYFKLNEDDLDDKTPSGQLRYKDRSKWAVDHLYRAGLLARIDRGRYVISNEGKNVLSKNLESIDEIFLMQYKSFRDFKNSKKTETP